MTSTQKFLNKQALVATAAAALFCLGAMPAQADLEWQLTSGGVPIAGTLVVDNSPNDTNPLVGAITVNAGAINTILTAAGSEYRLVTAGASTNCGNPAGCTGAFGLATITSAAEMTNSGSGGALDIDVTETNWLIPTTNPRTLINGPAATLTLLGAGDFMDSTGYNNPNNLAFSIAGAFATPTSVFAVGNPRCVAAGPISTCNDVQTKTGIVEGNPYSLSQVMNFSLTNSGIVKTIAYTDATTKFGPATVPEPTSLLLLGIGLAGLGFARRFKS